VQVRNKLGLGSLKPRDAAPRRLLLSIIFLQIQDLRSPAVAVATTGMNMHVVSSSGQLGGPAAVLRRALLLILLVCWDHCRCLVVVVLVGRRRALVRLLVLVLLLEGIHGSTLLARWLAGLGCRHLEA
jgi:hypothetical protein